MKRLYTIIFVAVLLALVLGLGIAKHPGYILIDYPHVFRYESGLWSTLAAVLAIGLVVLLVVGLLRLLLTSTRVVNPWSRRNRRRRIEAAVGQGQVDLAEGRWSSAQRHLRIAAEAERYPLFYYLGAARAANEQGHADECDALLERALERQPQAELAIALNHAQLQLDRGDAAGARETLGVMRERFPKNLQVLRQLYRLHLQQGDWAALIRLMPDLRHHKALPAADLASLEQQAWREGLVLAAAGSGGDTGRAELDAAWQQLSAAQRQEPALVLAYAEQLRRIGASAQAEEVLRGALKRQYDSHLARLYGLVRANDPLKQLQAAEGWLQQHGDDPGLLLTLGRLSLQNSLWGKARDYFEASLRQQRDPEACAELARLLGRLGDTERSNQLFQEGLGLLDERLLALPLPAGHRSAG
ncbi:heme biosynthesis HemY N-terminal domain-containing protein [Pseudomonas typographi]|uniref:Heme biosynthesis protein HemY n=1 Tax=Pseudomonas typographi TaxID=2715964 RepID=A0ABR7Z347_9PSED|nr:heme biosynthesis HemY N-terminal domain-containing protein [Pseudomonas typographi]MBD1550177.1 heme biosynthesis protein HemY [Pseudomonas typographi]MBD1586063.1 heme biosynthesis protein HemY [Pseudomonas typographi]MBD1599921.1 heme biosynthesis protein HemY [Pseudomonas typographi]